MKQTITQHVYMSYDYTSDYSGKEWMPVIKQWMLPDKDDLIYIGPQQFEVDLPGDFDPTAKQVAALERLREKVQAEFTAKLNEINTRISNLQALTYEVPA